jgi:hypothetical protein
VYLYNVFHWQRYLNISPKLTSIKPIFAELKACVSNFSKLGVYRRKVSIINAISLKHLCALDYFLETNNDFLVVLESDSLIPSKKEFISALSDVAELELGIGNFFCMLGSGFSVNRIGVAHIKSEVIGKLRVYDQAFSNTCSSYMLNRASAKLFKEFLNDYSKQLPYLPFDWLVNSILVKASKRGVSLLGVNLDRSPVLHGSRLGTTKSWQE